MRNRNLGRPGVSGWASRRRYLRSRRSQRKSPRNEVAKYTRHRRNRRWRMGWASSNFYNTYSASIIQSNKSLICRVRAAVALDSFPGNCEIQHQRGRCISNDTRLLRQTGSDIMAAFRWRSLSISIPPCNKYGFREISNLVLYRQSKHPNFHNSIATKYCYDERLSLHYRTSQPRKMIDSPR